MRSYPHTDRFNWLIAARTRLSPALLRSGVAAVLPPPTPFLRILKEQRKEHKEHFNVASLSLFGSVARDEASAECEVDLLVEFSEPAGLFQFIELQQRLEELLDCKVDLGTHRPFKPRIKKQVLQEAIRVA